jgi:antitoxin component of RelBE/YafQ-DinJ toxin-antitoxin module
MPTKDMTAISAKVRTKEKAIFEQLCETEGITASKAIRSFIIDCNERGAIAVQNDEQVLNNEQVLNDVQVPNDEPVLKLTSFMARHGITMMNQ